MATNRDFSDYESEAAVIAEIAPRPELLEVDGAPTFMALPSGYDLKSLEDFADRPYRRRGNVTLFDAESFVAYVRRFQDPASLVFCDLQQSRFTAVLDYHQSGPEGAAGHSQWKATFVLRQTEDWKRWTTANKRVMNQTDFATFLEDNLFNIAEPTGTEVLSLATNLQVKKDVSFRSSTRLHDGLTQLMYEETDAAKGEVKLPASIVLGIVPFEGAPAYRVDARLRYRLADAKLTLWYDLLRPDKVIETAFNEIRAGVIKGLPDTVILNGTAL